MFIDELILNGYDRLNTNNFKKIHFTFKKKIQIIIGTNGSGKSSILEELSPLPAESKYYSKDGYKLIKITHFGKRYILKPSFNPVFHSFKIDDEEYYIQLLEEGRKKEAILYGKYIVTGKQRGYPLCFPVTISSLFPSHDILSVSQSR